MRETMKHELLKLLANENILDDWQKHVDEADAAYEHEKDVYKSACTHINALEYPTADMEAYLDEEEAKLDYLSETYDIASDICNCIGQLKELLKLLDN